MIKMELINHNCGHCGHYVKYVIFRNRTILRQVRHLRHPQIYSENPVNFSEKMLQPQADHKPISAAPI